MNTLEAITKRRSHHEFKETKLSKEQLELLIKCGLCAPSCNNEQPWYLVGILNCETIHLLNDEINIVKDEVLKDYFYGAPALILVLGDKIATNSLVDCAVCTQNILLAAEDLNLASCWIDEVKALNQSEKFYDYQDQFQIPEGYEFMGGVALGERLKTPEEPEQRRGTWRIIE
ncbi:nitroreductase family protein [Turicibacter sp. TJ11]|uniref:nitroreductase family protein n=1 Tax=Turicibacter sp. TJ11 TaxID=2806443 RepID=UPI001F33109A|nr:nitroreductase family protein [Turicibacter sp. TJ11]